MIHVTCRLTAKNRDQRRNPTLGNRVRANFLLENVHTAWDETCIVLLHFDRVVARISVNKISSYSYNQGGS